MKNTLLPVVALASSASLTSLASAANISVSFTNEGNSGFFLTPLFAATHDGNFDIFSPGSAASAGLEALAEDGNNSVIATALDVAQPSALSTTIANAAGFGGAPVIDPNETATAVITGLDAVNNRYFSYGSMIIPTNDAFIANGNPLQYELFNAAGDFNGPITIQIFASQIWDAGTEINDGMGAPFQTGGGTSSDENGTVALAGSLDTFLTLERPGGLGPVADGFTLSPDELVATITIVPEPSSAIALGVAGLIGLTRRRR